MNNNKYAWSTPIERLMLWKTNNWMKYETKCENIYLHVNFDQIILSSNSKVLESLSLNTKVKGIYKQDVLILFVGLSGKEIRKIKFQIKDNVAHCLHKLGSHFPVVSYNGSKTCIAAKYQNIDEVFQSVLTCFNKDHDVINIPLPADYSNFMKLCLLDPTFPQVLKETEKLLKNIVQRDNSLHNK